MDNPWWQPLLQWTLWGIAMFFLMGWLARSRHKKRSPEQSNQLRHPCSLLILGSIGFLFFAALTVISNVIPNDTTTWWTTSIFAGFAVMSLYFLLDYFRARHEWTNSGVFCARLFLPRQHLAWNDIKAIEYAERMKWFRIETHSGDVGRISALMIGLPEFAQAVLSQVSSEAIDPDTWEVLEMTAYGEPPSLWG